MGENVADERSMRHINNMLFKAWEAHKEMMENGMPTQLVIQRMRETYVTIYNQFKPGHLGKLRKIANKERGKYCGTWSTRDELAYIQKIGAFAGVPKEQALKGYIDGIKKRDKWDYIKGKKVLQAAIETMGYPE